MTHPATDLRNHLEVAARAAQQFGATKAQIDLIVALARGSRQFYLHDSGHFTFIEARSLILSLQDDGAVADYDKSEEELDDEDAFAAGVARDAAQRKASKHQKKVAKEFRINQKAEELRKIEGRRVHHPAFGEGTVIAEDDKVVAVLFDGEKKPKRLIPSGVTAA